MGQWREEQTGKEEFRSISGREGETVKQTDGLQHYRPRKEDK